MRLLIASIVQGTKYCTMKLIEFTDPIQPHDTLNPALWDNDQLQPTVRHALIRIAEDFKEFIDVPFKVLDIVVAGGNANYTYTPHSDIDVHIIADYASVSCDRTAAELFDTKRLLYKNEYTITVRDIPVELYVEDHRYPAVSSSYSILTDEWVLPPKSDIPQYDHKEVEHMVGVWETLIQRAMKTRDLSVCRTAIHLVRQYRKAGLKSPAGEFSVPNLVYKSLRNNNTVNAMTTLIDQLHSKDLSLDQ